VPRKQFIIGVPHGGYWRELLNSDATLYGGSGMGNAGGVEAEQCAAHGRPCRLRLTLPPLAIVVFRSP
jgi:1,4-alpha-glucan branching enzyme